MHAPFFILTAAAVALLQPASAAPGDPDAGFGTGGGFIMELSGGHDVVNAVALQGDGKVLLAGHAAPDNFTLLRLNTDGTLDTDFGMDGKFQHKFGAFESAIGVAVQSSGKIVLGGAGLVKGVNREFAVVRCLKDGTLDPSFGNGGTSTTAISGHYDEQVYAMARHSDDSILLGGYYRDDLAMVRFLPDGTLDSSFGNEGKVFTPDSSVTDKQINALAIMSDGRIVAAGQSAGNNNTDVLVARFLSNGFPDVGFGTAGRTYTAAGPGRTGDVANSVAVLADGKVLAGGTSGGKFLLLRYTSGGVLDSSFGNSGIATIGFPGAEQKGTGLVVQPDGKIILTGTVSANARNYFAAVRFDANGLADSTFGSGGGIVTALTSGSENAYAAALQSDGKLLIAGSGGLEGNQSMAAVRYETMGTQTLAQWRKFHFGNSDNSGTAANDSDADRDGLINLLEYAFGQSPTLASSCAVPEGGIIGGNFVSTFTAPSTVTDITYAAEWSPTITAGSWQPLSDTGSGSVHTFSMPTDGHTELYLRWRITTP